MRTEVIFILDMSGSMNPLKEDTIGGFNSMIEDLKKLDDKTLVSVALFNGKWKLIARREIINEIAPLDLNIYKPCGTTALLDAIGNTIGLIETFMIEEEPEPEPDKVLVYITTDGMENSSTEYNYKMIKNEIKRKKKDGWEFNFLASGIDELAEGKRLGIDRANIYRVENSKDGQREMYQVMYRVAEAKIKK